MTGGYWLSEAQSDPIRPYLPDTTRVMARIDDRRVISGIIPFTFCSQVADGAIRQDLVALARPSAIASSGGPGKAFGPSSCITQLRLADLRLR